MDVSLDSYIKKNKISKNPRKTRNVISKAGKRRNSFGNGRKTGRPMPNRRNAPRRSAPARFTPAPQKQSASCTILIDNLYFGVNDTDIKEIFQDFGTIRRCGINYQKNGKSQGTASVVFNNPSSAIRARSKYNNIALDGRRMNISIVPEATSKPIAPPRRSLNAKKRLSHGPTDFNRGKRRSNNFFKSGPNNAKRPARRSNKASNVRTEEQLNSDIDKYNDDYCQ